MGQNKSESQEMFNSLEIPEEQKETKYVVVRNGYRVSSNDYLTKDDPNAISEKKFWENVVSKQTCMETIEIVEYDNKLHRIW